VPLSAEAIRRAFEELSRELAHSGERGQMVVVGGAALVLLFGARQTTKDVDAYFLAPQAARMRAAAARLPSASTCPRTG